MSLAPCLHKNTEVRRKIASNDRPMYGLQCVDCGNHQGGWIRKEDWPPDAPPWDDEAHVRWWEEQRGLRDMEKQADHAAWLLEHDKYLKTEQWTSLRQRVCEREGGICQGCRGKRGKQAHHVTYDRWRNELLTDLVWFCDDCHGRAHGR